MRRILPEVEHAIAVKLSGGDAVIGIEDLKDRVVILLIVGAALQLLENNRIVLLDPFELLGAANVFEPQIRVRSLSSIHSRYRSKAEQKRGPDAYPEAESHKGISISGASILGALAAGSTLPRGTLA